MPDTPEKTSRTIWKLLAVALVVCLVALVIARLNERISFKQDVLTPAVFTVDAGSLSSFPFDVYKSGHVLGRFQTSQGNGERDDAAITIEAVITDARDFENWKNGLPVRVLYRSDRISKGSIDIPVPPGKYTLAFNNRHSPLVGKTITANILLNQ